MWRSPQAGGDAIAGRPGGCFIVFCADRETSCRQAVAEAVEICVRFALARISVGDLVKALRVTGLQEMGELVNDDAVQYPLGDGLEAGGDPDLPRVERARSPAPLLA